MSEPAQVITGRLALIWVVGPDAVPFLDGLLSQNIGAIGVGATGRSLLLAPNGKLRGILFVLRGEDRVGLVGDAGKAADVVADLRRFKIRVDVEITAEQTPVWELWDQEVADDAPGPGEWVDSGGLIRFRMPFLNSSASRLVIVGDSGLRNEATHEDVEARRIELGEPVVGIDVDDKTIPQEVVDTAEFVDFAKGCYLGQELVARIDSRGHVNRRLAGLILGSAVPPQPGAVIMAGSQAVGEVTSASFSRRLNKTVALAMVRTAIDDGESVVVAGVPAEVAGLPIVS